MKRTPITKRSADDRRTGKTDWAKVDALSDPAIRRAVATDPDAAPLLDEAWFRAAEIVVPPGKDAISLRLDRDLLAWFRGQGRGYQSRMNAVLRAYMQAHRKAG